MNISTSYTPTFISSARAVRDVQYAAPSGRWLRRIGWVLAALGVITAFIESVDPSIAVTLLGIAFLILFLLWLMPYMFALLARRGSPIATAKQHIAVDGHGIRTEAGDAEGFLSWMDVTRVVESKRHLLLYTRTGVAAVIPKYALVAEGALEQFRRLAATHAGVPDSSAAVAATMSSDIIGNVLYEVSYRWSRAELYAASMALAKHGSRGWLWTLFMVALVTYIGGPTILRQWEEGGFGGISWGLVLMYAAPLLIYLVAPRLAGFRYAHVKTRDANGDEQRLTIGELGVSGQGAMSTTGVRWRSLSKVVETRRFVLFFLNRYSGLVLPKKLLTQGEVQTLRQHLSDQLGSAFVFRGVGRAMQEAGGAGAGDNVT